MSFSSWHFLADSGSFAPGGFSFSPQLEAWALEIIGEFFFFCQIWPQANLPSPCRWYISMKIALSSGLYVYIMWNLEIDSNRIKRQSSLFCLNSEEKVREQLNVEKRKKRKTGNEEINWEQENDGKWKERIADLLHTHTSSPDSQ